MKLLEMIGWIALGFLPTIAIGQLICTYNKKSGTVAKLIKLKIKN